MSAPSRQVLREAQRWVIKLGSGVLLSPEGRIDRPTFASLLRAVNVLLDRGAHVTIVSSGAVALGRQALGHDLAQRQRRDVPQLQALAALGQARLIQLYEHELSFYDRRPAQVLFSRADLDDRQRYLNARAALRALDALGVIPVINENDTVATEELRFGDNDQLAAMTCGLVHADALVILSDVDGIYDVEEGDDGSRRFTTRFEALSCADPRLDVIAGPPRSGVGTGGMTSKVRAARVAARFGTPTVIAPGKRPGVLEALSAGEPIGTLLYPEDQHNLTGKKVWLSAAARHTGTIWCDEGAVRALTQRGASLLPSGITRVEGDFVEGAVVELCTPLGETFARGVSIYDADALRRIARHKSEEIEGILGYHLLDAAIHRDDLIILGVA